MPTETYPMSLWYDDEDLAAIFDYAEAHQVEENGRYDVSRPSRINIWTHTWSTPALKDESSIMFSVVFDSESGTLTSVMMLPGFDMDVFFDELARLEWPALGRLVHGKRITD
jgi:hypothetical protein